MNTMLCKVESWPNTIISQSPDREETRIFGKVPYARQQAREIARDMSRRNIKRDYAIATYNDNLGWINYEIFRGGYEVYTTNIVPKDTKDDKDSRYV